MTQKDKELLSIDLCARLPYGVKVQDDSKEIKTLTVVYPHDYKVDVVSLDFVQKRYIDIYEIKSYLRPMSSMTEEEFKDLQEFSGLKYEQLDLTSFPNNHKCLDFYLNEIPSDVVILVFDWLNKNHFDYRGLIEKGLALPATDGMY